jgi:hypothetical protein
VIGQYNDHGGNVLGYLLGEQNGSWGHAVELQLPPVSSTEERLSLLAILIPEHPSARLAQVRSVHHFDYAYQAVAPGRAASAWFASSGRRRVLIAAGSTRIDGPGRVKLELQVTGAGRRLLAGAKHVHVTVVAAFKPRGHHAALGASASFTLS